MKINKTGSEEYKKNRINKQIVKENSLRKTRDKIMNEINKISKRNGKNYIKQHGGKKETIK